MNNTSLFFVENCIQNLAKNNNIILKNMLLLLLEQKTTLMIKNTPKVQFPKGIVSKIIRKFEKYKDVLSNIYDNTERFRILSK